MRLGCELVDVKQRSRVVAPPARVPMGPAQSEPDAVLVNGHKGGERWLDLELDLWLALADTVKEWGRKPALRPG